MHTLGAIAEFERARIQERIKAGIARARAQEVKLGRPRRYIDAAKLESVSGLPNVKPRGASGFLGRRLSGSEPG
jgi:DNA invertase Pin-like site-specific DNA recombinase